MRRRHRHLNARDLGAKLVLDARYIDQSDNTAVSTWSDRSGNGYDATQTNGTFQPTFQTAEFGGNGVVRFDGSDDRLLANGAAGVLRNVNEGTLIGVGRIADASANARSLIAFAYGTDTNGPHRAILGSENASGYYAGGRRLDANSFQSALTSSYTQNRILIKSAVFDWANSDLFVFLDGTQSASNTNFQTAGSTSDTNSASVTIGSGANGQRLNGDLGQALAFNTALTASQRKRVEHAAAFSFKISCN
jgi:hypothetical protein